METKKWYKSKGVWSGAFVILIALYNIAIKLGAPFNPLWEEVYIILGGLGIYSRKVAKTKLCK